MIYGINYSNKVEKDLSKIADKKLLVIKRFIELKLISNPIYLGKNLHGNLKGFRAVRVGDYRIIYQVKNKTIIILAIGHRKNIYEMLENRIK